MQVYYRRLIEGVTIPAIIHNGSYFLINMPVYEDGSIDCWDRVSLAEVPERFKDGWLVASIPDGEALSVHDLGSFRVQNARWSHTPESYTKYIGEVVKSMNSEMTGLFQDTAEQKKKWEEHRVAWITHGKPYKVTGNTGYNRTDGFSGMIFTRFDGIVRLENITGFAGDAWQIDSRGSVTTQEIKDMIAQNLLLCAPPSGVPVCLGGLGAIEVSETLWPTDPAEKWKELLEYPNRAAGKETAHGRCVAAYHEYLEDPNEYTRGLLREAYEAVPEHERIYLGSMDYMDSDYKRILFYPDNKREV